MSLGQKLDNVIERMESDKKQEENDNTFSKFINSPFRTTSTSLNPTRTQTDLDLPSTANPKMKISPK